MATATMATATATLAVNPFVPLGVVHAGTTALAHGLRGRLLGILLFTALFGKMAFLAFSYDGRSVLILSFQVFLHYVHASP